MHVYHGYMIGYRVFYHIFSVQDSSSGQIVVSVPVNVAVKTPCSVKIRLAV